MTIKKRSSTKANYAVKNAPSFCEILFVYKGKHIWTRDASESEEPFVLEAHRQTLTESIQYTNSEAVESPQYLHSTSANIICRRLTDWLHGDSFYSEMTRTACTTNGAEFKFEEEDLSGHLAEALPQVEASRNEAFQELVKRQRLEKETIETLNKVLN